jgi:hypothetical protein
MNKQERAKVTVTREERMPGVRWIHYSGPWTNMRQVSAVVAAEARRWAKELGCSRAYRVSSGAGFFSNDEIRYSVSYVFE